MPSWFRAQPFRPPTSGRTSSSSLRTTSRPGISGSTTRSRRSRHPSSTSSPRTGWSSTPPITWVRGSGGSVHALAPHGHVGPHALAHPRQAGPPQQSPRDQSEDRSARPRAVHHAGRLQSGRLQDHAHLQTRQQLRGRQRAFHRAQRDATKRGGTAETGSAWHGQQVLDYLDERKAATRRRQPLPHLLRVLPPARRARRHARAAREVRRGQSHRQGDVPAAGQPEAARPSRPTTFRPIPSTTAIPAVATRWR